MKNITTQKPNHKKKRGFLAVVLLAILCGTIFFGIPKAKRYFYPRTFSAEVELYGAEYGVDPLLLYAIIRTESGFDPQAESNVGARGLMQITEETFAWIKLKIAPHEAFTFDDMYSADINIRFGGYFFAKCVDRYEDLPTAIAAYHSGWGTVDALLENESYSSDGMTLHTFPYPQMERYVYKVTKAYDIYQTLYT